MIDESPGTARTRPVEPPRLTPRHDRHPRRDADRGRGMRIRKPHALAREPIETRRLDEAPVPAETLDVPDPEVVRHDDDDVYWH